MNNIYKGCHISNKVKNKKTIESNLSGSDVKVWAAIFISPRKEVAYMVNDEVNNKAINIEIKVAQYSAKAILKAMKKIIEDAAEKSQPLADYLSEKRKTNSRKLKDMVKKGQLENIDLQKGEVKELKNQLNRYGVNFSVMKNKESGLYSVFFQAKDTKAVDIAFKKAIERYEKKENKRDSTREVLNKFKMSVKNTVVKNKVKEKHHQQER